VVVPVLPANRLATLGTGGEVDDGVARRCVLHDRVKDRLVSKGGKRALGRQRAVAPRRSQDRGEGDEEGGGDGWGKEQHPSSTASGCRCESSECRPPRPVL
jgi:hypothetical protein